MLPVPWFHTLILLMGIQAVPASPRAGVPQRFLLARFPKDQVKEFYQGASERKFLDRA